MWLANLSPQLWPENILCRHRLLTQAFFVKSKNLYVLSWDLLFYFTTTSLKEFVQCSITMMLAMSFIWFPPILFSGNQSSTCSLVMLQYFFCEIKTEIVTLNTNGAHILSWLFTCKQLKIASYYEKVSYIGGEPYILSLLVLVFQ